MNRRNFFSMLAGAAGATLVPWRGLTCPTIFLPNTSVPSVDEIVARMARDWMSTVGRVNDLVNEFASQSLLASQSYEEVPGFFSGSFYGVVDSYLQPLHMRNGLIRDNGGRILHHAPHGLPFENGRIVLPPELSA